MRLNFQVLGLFGILASLPWAHAQVSTDLLDFHEESRILRSWERIEAETQKGIETGWSLDFSQKQVKARRANIDSKVQRLGLEFLKTYHASDLFKKTLSHASGFVLPNRNTAPLVNSAHLESLQTFDYPRDHLTVARDGRIFADVFNHDETFETKIIVFDPATGTSKPFPSLNEQRRFVHVHSLRADQQDRLWLLDSGKGLFVKPALYAYDIHTGERVHEYHFPPSIAGAGSLLNDFVVDERRNILYISETGPYPIFGTPALVIYSISKKEARRVLSGHVSVSANNHSAYIGYNSGKKWTYAGFFAPKVAVDGIAYDSRRDFVYWAPNNSGLLYGMAAGKLSNFSLSEGELRKEVDFIAHITMTDGMTVDKQGNVILTDPEHSALVRVDPLTGILQTLVQDKEKMPFVSNVEFGADGYLYFAAFPFHVLLEKSPQEIKAMKERFPIYRISF